MTVSDSVSTGTIELLALADRIEQRDNDTRAPGTTIQRIHKSEVALAVSAIRAAAQGQPGCGEIVAFVPLTQDGRPQWAETFAADDGCYIDYPEKWRALYAASRPLDPAEGMEALREIEIAWLSDRLSESIAGLGYPVGMGISPHPDSIKKAATILFERYAKMIGMARRAVSTQKEPS